MNNEKIILQICNLMDVAYSDLISKSRKREHVDCRKMIVNYFVTHTRLSLNEIGKLIGNRDHTTIIHEREEAKNLLKNDESFRDMWGLVSQIIISPISFTAMGKQPVLESA